jgi:hypothetical protein
VLSDDGGVRVGRCREDQEQAEDCDVEQQLLGPREHPGATATGGTTTGPAAGGGAAGAASDGGAGLTGALPDAAGALGPGALVLGAERRLVDPRELDRFGATLTSPTLLGRGAGGSRATTTRGVGRELVVGPGGIDVVQAPASRLTMPVLLSVSPPRLVAISRHAGTELE